MSKENGGQAFPCCIQSQMHGHVDEGMAGMTLRDYFAAHAPAVPDDFGWAYGETDCYQRTIRWEWFYADAMLEARK